MAPPATPVATSIAANSATAFTGVAGETLPERPSVIVMDQRGVGMSGVTVTFAVTSGNGSVTGGSATTNTAGIAAVDGWTLGAVVGPNSLTASTRGLAPVTFIATGIDEANACAGSVITCVLLPTLGGNSSQALALNDAGIAVGYSNDNSGALPAAVRWTRASDGLWSITSIGNPNSIALAVNVHGAVVGVSAGRGKLWPAGGGEIDLGLHLPRGINGAETIVGTRIPDLTANPLQRAVVWRKPSTGWDLSSPNLPQDLPVFPGGAGETGSRAINEAGIISGAVALNDPVGYRAVRWDPVGDQWGTPTELPGTASSGVTSAGALSDNAQPDFAGHKRECLTTCTLFGIFWPSGSSRTNLDPLFVGATASAVFGINNAQRVVGFRGTQVANRAFVWWPGLASLQDLGGPPNHPDTEAFDINNLSPSQAAGYARSETAIRAVVWTIP